MFEVSEKLCYPFWIFLRMCILQTGRFSNEIILNKLGVIKRLIKSEQEAKPFSKFAGVSVVMYFMNSIKKF